MTSEFFIMFGYALLVLLVALFAIALISILVKVIMRSYYEEKRRFFHATFVQRSEKEEEGKEH